jgi:hypothetical protein
MKRRAIILGTLFVVMTVSLAFGLDVGEMAPVFRADSTEGPINLADYRDQKNVVLALYFAVFTRV